MQTQCNRCYFLLTSHAGIAVLIYVFRANPRARLYTKKVHKEQVCAQLSSTASTVKRRSAETKKKVNRAIRHLSKYTGVFCPQQPPARDFI